MELWPTFLYNTIAFYFLALAAITREMQFETSLNLLFNVFHDYNPTEICVRLKPGLSSILARESVFNPTVKTFESPHEIMLSNA